MAGNRTERDMVMDLRLAKERLDAAKEEKAEAQKAFDKVEAELAEHLTTLGAESTASYDGVGYAKMNKPRLYASCLKENEEALKDYLRKQGREDLVRETVAAPALSAYAAELIAEGKEVPPIINYYLKTNVRIY